MGKGLGWAGDVVQMRGWSEYMQWIRTQEGRTGGQGIVGISRVSISHPDQHNEIRKKVENVTRLVVRSWVWLFFSPALFLRWMDALLGWAAMCTKWYNERGSRENGLTIR